jgi:hypothetical protein
MIQLKKNQSKKTNTSTEAISARYIQHARTGSGMMALALADIAAEASCSAIRIS